MTASHLHAGEPGPIAKVRTAARDVPKIEMREIPVTSPASGAGSTADLPDYAPVPRSALGPALDDQGCYVGRVERNLYWVIGGIPRAAFPTTPDGVVLCRAVARWCA